MWSRRVATVAILTWICWKTSQVLGARFIKKKRLASQKGTRGERLLAPRHHGIQLAISHYQCLLNHGKTLHSTFWEKYIFINFLSPPSSCVGSNFLKLFYAIFPGRLNTFFVQHDIKRLKFDIVIQYLKMFQDF